MAQACDEGGGFPVSVRYTSDAALALGGTSACARHVGAGAGLIQKNQLGNIQGGLIFLPFTPRDLYVFAPLLAGAQRFF